ncbi:hypothetical protein A2524_04560 [Candidatus Wolfebacteria bacterium RIFOXYD12_FULL_48_21]|uniref:Uncharacterized protein n=1 Tax=Candidatus Wolfebacteria bacterium RIFOXYD1_FULL_48_65 TaxID=1802561 RepID=A0A1F8E5M8_9BACT|nr:MAG: hypothetical protein A2524_04560 [Candidatus Wolfebacteria bacterium RIFOXYD12_FULL_48_21]OGM95649.1 MAG: hypothetical protein A2610_02405 [Candidatus Wolfebacteria bacterium RIFOXYD1_FULL_48_65]OGM96751.1 MAG: hypothetical protein A2532_04165 [Candidatus Wolfebacteria bacterium RIFOXYD2_FULL_48_11]
MEKKSFVIDVNGRRPGNRTIKEKIVAIVTGQYGLGDTRINRKNFPMRPMPAGPRKIVLVDYDRAISADEVLAEAERRGLERPRHEDALFFGEQHPEEPCRAPIVFLHEPWRGSVLFLGYGGGSMRNYNVNISLSIDEGAKWGAGCRFAFVQK